MELAVAVFAFWIVLLVRPAARREKGAVVGVEFLRFNSYELSRLLVDVATEVELTLIVESLLNARRQFELTRVTGGPLITILPLVDR